MIAVESDVVLVVCSTNSSNSNRLREVAEREGTPAYLLDDPAMVQPQWLEHGERIGVTAGASAPEELVQQVIDRLRELGGQSVRTLEGVEGKVSLPLPREIASTIARRDTLG